jgi:hypothetical protein
MPQYLFDTWSLIHFLGWGVATAFIPRMYVAKAILMAVMIGTSWELFELAVAEPYLRFAEPWYNRWITDPIANISGAVMGSILGRLCRRVRRN